MLWEISKKVCFACMAIALICGLVWMKVDPISTKADVLSWIIWICFGTILVISISFAIEEILGKQKWRVPKNIILPLASLMFLTIGFSGIKSIYEMPLEIRTDYWQNAGGVQRFWLCTIIFSVGLCGVSKILVNLLDTKKKE